MGRTAVAEIVQKRKTFPAYSLSKYTPLSLQIHNPATLHQPRLNAVQAVRALAALMVAYLHAIGLQVNPPHPFHQSIPGLMEVLSAGVDIFFVLSGFIITHSASRYSGGSEALHFLKKRFLRINPVYYVALLLFLAVSWHWLIKNHQLPTIPAILKAILLLPVADNKYSLSILPIAWTLSFEWLFYFLFALAIFMRSRNKVRFLVVLGTILVACHYILPIPDDRIRFITDPMLLEFLLGMLIYRCYILLTPTTAIAASLVIAGILLLVYHGCWGRTDLGNPIYILDSPLVLQRFLWLGVPGGLLLSGCVFLEKSGAMRFLWNNRIVNLFGDASYSLYLTHYTVYSIGEAIAFRFRPIPSADLSVFTWLFIAVIFGLLFYRTVERPLVRAFK
jgi:exopolysaccharide production protein ExoZ